MQVFFNSRIFLIGFMGSGKSTLGKKLSRLLQFDFIDTDKEVEKKTGRTISEIFRQEGELFFRKEERKILESLSGKENIVVSTGGGMPCFENNMFLMKQLGITVYLYAPVALLAQRLAKSKQERPLLKAVSEKDLTTVITEMLSEREPYYKQADIALNACSLTATDILNSIKLL